MLDAFGNALGTIILLHLYGALAFAYIFFIIWKYVLLTLYIIMLPVMYGWFETHISWLKTNSQPLVLFTGKFIVLLTWPISLVLFLLYKFLRMCIVGLYHMGKEIGDRDD